jgi:hypothetical protein
MNRPSFAVASSASPLKRAANEQARDAISSAREELRPKLVKVGKGNEMKNILSFGPESEVHGRLPTRHAPFR